MTCHQEQLSLYLKVHLLLLQEKKFHKQEQDLQLPTLEEEQMLQHPEEGAEEGAHLGALQGKEWQQMLLQHLVQQLQHLEDHQEEGTIE
jgi:hypothetical protein